MYRLQRLTWQNSLKRKRDKLTWTNCVSNSFVTIRWGQMANLRRQCSTCEHSLKSHGTTLMFFKFYTTTGQLFEKQLRISSFWIEA
jgi:hypothetical protein